MELIMIRG